jgi:hypothetical protein
VEDLFDQLGVGDGRAVQRGAGAIFQAVEALVFIAVSPPAEHGATDAVIAAGGRDTATDLST